MGADTLQLLIYTSRLAAIDRPVEDILADIRRVAQARNPDLGVTGVLLFHGGRFLQVLEGEKAVLEALMERIARDCRHQEVTRLVDEPIERRSLAEWNMEAFAIGDAAIFSEDGLRFVRDALHANVMPEGAAFVRTLRQMLGNRRMVELIRLRAA